MSAGMLAFGVEEWSSKADGFGAYFGMLGRMAPLCREADGTICARRPLSGLTGMPVTRGRPLSCAR